MIDCADSTALRAHLDEPDPRLDEHLDDCTTCAGLLRSVADDAGYSRRTLALLAPSDAIDVDVEAALLAVQARITLAEAPVRAAAVAREASTQRRTTTVRRRWAMAIAAIVGVVATALTPAGNAALADVLDVFRGERLQVVTVDPEEWGEFLEGEDADLIAAFADIDTSGLDEPGPVAGAAEAEAVAGIEAPTVPDGAHRLVAMAPGTARVVLRARPGNGVPARLDGAALVVDAPGAIAAIYRLGDGRPQLVVGRSGPLVVRAEGASLEEIRSFLLEREELPRGLRAQLADIDDWRSTIPVPVPVDGPGWRDVEVAGRPAIAFGDDSGAGAIVLRQDAEGVTLVGGRVSVSRALEVAADA